MYKALTKINEEKLKTLDSKQAEEVLSGVLKYVNKYLLTKDEEGHWVSSRNNDNDIRLFCVELSDDEKLLPFLDKIWMIDNDGKYEDCIEGHYDYLKNKEKYQFAEEMDEINHE